MQYWLMKSEADCYSIDDLKRDKTTPWTEVRNYQARNFMCDMKKGDKALFYHSNGGDETGVVGEMKVAKQAYADPTQFKKGEYFDEKATKTNPRWFCVDVSFVEKFKHPVYLSHLKNDPKFTDMTVAQKGNRLSVMPVAKKHYEAVLKMSK